MEHQERGVIAWRQHPDGYPVGWCESLEAHGGDREKAESAARARAIEAAERA